MRTLKNINKDIEETGDMRGLIQVYEELAATTMNEIRGEITASRAFFEDLARVSAEVGADLFLGSKEIPKDVAVFMSAETGLFGDIIDKIFVDFTSFVRKNKGIDVVVVGRMGQTLMKSLAPDINFTFFDLDDDKYSEEALAAIMSKIIVYKQIFLFHGKFENIITQETWTTAISGQVLLESQKRDQVTVKYNYLYEPDPVKVAAIFSQEIALAIFNNSLKESRLAKYASRLMFLDSSIDKIDGRVSSLFFEKGSAQKKLNAKRQLLTVAGIMCRKRL